MQYLKRLDYIVLCKLLKSEILILFCAAAPRHQDSPTYSSESKTVQKFNEHLLKNTIGQSQVQKKPIPPDSLKSTE